MNPEVDAYIRASKRWPEEITELRPILQSAALTEEIKWGRPCYSHEGKNIVIVQEMKDFLALMFGTRRIRILVSAIVVLLLVAAAACGGQQRSPSETAATTAPAPTSAAGAGSTDATAPPAESLPSSESDAAEISPGSSQRADSPAPSDLDASEAAGATGVGAADLEGRWEGVTEVPGFGELLFAVTFTASGDGLRGTIDIQGAAGLSLSNTALDSGRVHFELVSPLGLAAWDGQVGNGAIEGEFTQGGLSGAFRLQRADDQRLPSGEHVDDAMFRREEVVFSNGEIVLAGELTLPEGDGPHPGVVLISGSGGQDRDSNLFGFPMFAVLADHLARIGVASVRFDDRGIGDSTGDGLQETIENRAGDVEAAVDLLVARHDIDADLIGLVGHSEGGIVAPLVAVRSDRVAFVVLLAAPAVAADETLRAQQLELLQDASATAEEIEEAQALQRLVFRAVATGWGWDEVEASIRALAKQQLDALPEDRRNAIPDLDAYLDVVVAQELATWQSAWFASFFDYDPRPAIVSLSVPVLALYGELDTQVPAGMNSTAMSGAIAESDVPRHTLATIARANHLFQEASTGSVNEYAQLRPEFAPELLDALTAWFADQLGSR